MEVVFWSSSPTVFAILGISSFCVSCKSCIFQSRKRFQNCLMLGWSYLHAIFHMNLKKYFLMKYKTACKTKSRKFSEYFLQLQLLFIIQRSSSITELFHYKLKIFLHLEWCQITENWFEIFTVFSRNFFIFLPMRRPCHFQRHAISKRGKSNFIFVSKDPLNSLR